MESGLHAIASHVPMGRRSPDYFLDQFAEELGINTGFIGRSTQILFRSIAPPCSLPSDLAVRAGRKAIDQFKARGGDPDDIGAIFFCGMRPDVVEPTTAHTIASRLGISPGIVRGINDACNGFGAGLMAAHDTIGADRTKFALVVTGELGSRSETATIETLRNMAGSAKARSRDWAATFTLGDAGGAVVLGEAADSLIKIKQIESVANCEAHKICRITTDSAPLDVDQSHLKNVVKDLIWPAFAEFKKEHCVSKQAYYIVHQTSPRVLREMSGLAQIQPGRVINTVAHCGNLISASFPVQLDLLTEEIKPGDDVAVMLAGSGVSATFMHMQAMEQLADIKRNRKDECHTSTGRAAAHEQPLETT